MYYKQLFPLNHTLALRIGDGRVLSRVFVITATGNTAHDMMWVCVEEKRYRITRHLTGVVISEMSCAQEPIIGPMLQQLSSVYNKRIFDDRCIDPYFTTLAENC